MLFSDFFIIALERFCRHPH